VLNWLNSDDCLLPGALEQVALQHRRTPEHLLSGGYVTTWGRARVSRPKTSGLETEILAQHWKYGNRWHQAAHLFHCGYLAHLRAG